MAQPYNYMLNLPDPSQQLMQTVQGGLAIKDQIAQTRAREAQAAKAQYDLKAKQRMNDELAALSQDPNPSALAALSIKYPEMSDNFKRSYDMLGEEQKKSRVGKASQVYAALRAGQPEVAQQLLDDQVAAYRNGGQEDEAKSTEALAEMIKTSPDTAATTAGLYLSQAMGPEKFVETFTKLETSRRDSALEPSELTESQAKAKKAAVEAKFAESDAVADLQRKGWDITKIRSDISIARENTRIAAMKAQYEREDKELKKQELQMKIDDAERKRDETVRGKSAEVESARGSMDNMLNTIDRVLQTPIGVIESATGPISTMTPTLSQDTADFEELIATVRSQAFVAQIPNIKGMGALSDAEGKKLEASLQSLSLRQSPARLMENLREIQRLILKARGNLTTRYGVPESIPDTPAAAADPSEIDALVNKYTGTGATGAY